MLCSEVLSIFLKEQMPEGAIRGDKPRNDDPTLNHILFTDDFFLFSRLGI